MSGRQGRRTPHREPAAIPGLDVAKAKRYSRTRLVVLLLSTLWSAACWLWLASDRRAARLKASVAGRAPDSRLTAPAFLGGYLVERRYGLTKQPVKGWFGDQLKGLVVGVLIQTPLLTGAYAVMRRRPRDWWLVLAGL